MPKQETSGCAAALIEVVFGVVVVYKRTKSTHALFLYLLHSSMQASSIYLSNTKTTTETTLFTFDRLTVCHYPVHVVNVLDIGVELALDEEIISIGPHQGGYSVVSIQDCATINTRSCGRLRQARKALTYELNTQL